MKLIDSTLPSMYSKGLFETKTFDLAPEHTEKIFDILFTATGNILQGAKTKDHPVAFVFDSDTKEFVAASIVQFFEGEDGNPGNWNMVWTFNEADVPENAIRLDLSNPMTHSQFIAVAGAKYGIQFKTDAALCILVVYALMQLKKWLDENAKEANEVTIEHDGLFQARVTVENGVKVFAIEPDGEIKQLIKDDASIEK